MRAASIVVAALALLLAPSPAVAADDWAWPAEGRLVTPYRNGDDPYAGGQHRGIDVAAPAGRDVTAATAGTVTFAGSVGSAGLTVSIRTADGRFDTSYLHLDRIDVRAGDHVDAGTRLGAVGSSGRGSFDGPHLHFGVREAGSRTAYRDPLDFLPGPAPETGPRPVPVPVGAREREPTRGPAPAPAPLPARRPAPIARPGPLPAPGLLPLPAPHAAPRPLPEAAGRRGVRPLPAPARRPERSAPRHGSLEPDGEPARSPDREPSRPPAAGPGRPDLPPSTRPQPVRDATPGLRTPLPRPGGLDLGWVVACLGLGLAAAAAVRRDVARAAARRAHDVLGALRRPAGRGG